MRPPRLKRCPFCAGEAKFFCSPASSAAWVACQRSSCQAMTIQGDRKDIAAKIWNRRVKLKKRNRK